MAAVFPFSKLSPTVAVPLIMHMSSLPQLKEAQLHDNFSSSLASYRLQALGGRKTRTRQTMPEEALRRAFTYERELLTSKFGPRTPLLLPVSLASTEMTDRDLHALTERFPLTQHRQRGNTSSYLQTSPLETKTVSYILEEIKESQQQTGSELADLASRLKGANPCLILCTKILGDGHRPEAREGGTLTAVQGKLYLFGGRCRKLFNDIKVLDTATLRWEEPKLQSSPGTLPEPRVNHTTVAYQHNLVVYGGCERFNDILQIRNCFPLVHIYDTRTPHSEQRTWTSVKPAGRGPETRRCHSAVVVGKVMFFYGGMDRTGKVLEDLQAVNLGQAYAENMTWVTPSMSKRSFRPGARSGASLTLVFSHEALASPNMDLFNPPKAFDEVFTPSTCGVYMIGGVNEKGIASSEVYILRAKKMSVRDDRPSLMWVKPDIVGTPPEPRYDHGACLCRHLLFIYGGRDDSLFRKQSHCELKSFSILNIESQRWDKIELLGSPPSGRWGFAMTAVDSKIYIFGGMKLSKFCSSKINVLETDQNIVKDRAAGLRGTKKNVKKRTKTLRGGSCEGGTLPSRAEEGKRGARRKTVGLLTTPDYKGSSDVFRRLSRSFEQGEYTLAVATVSSSSESLRTSDTEESRSLVGRIRVRLVELPGLGESSPSFRRKSREFEKGEFSLAKHLLQKSHSLLRDGEMPPSSEALFRRQRSLSAAPNRGV